MTYNPQGLIKVLTGAVRKRNDKGDDTVLSHRSSHHPTPIEYVNYPTSLLFYDMVRGETRIHPTQKPVDLIRYLIRTYSNPGDTILDNCMGSGTTAVAAVMEKRKFIGFETDKTYYEKANKRLRDLTGPFHIYGNIGV